MGTEASPCFIEDERGRLVPLPDPQNRCDTLETIADVMRTNTALNAAKKAAGVPLDTP